MYVVSLSTHIVLLQGVGVAPRCLQEFSNPTQLRIDKNYHFKIIAKEKTSIPTPYYTIVKDYETVIIITYIYVFKAKVERKCNYILKLKYNFVCIKSISYLLCTCLSLIVTIEEVGRLTQIFYLGHFAWTDTSTLIYFVLWFNNTRHTKWIAIYTNFKIMNCHTQCLILWCLHIYIGFMFKVIKLLVPFNYLSLLFNNLFQLTQLGSILQFWQN